ncbi:MAG: acyl-CoA synthetase, partial [Pseudomonadota bacterium]
EMPCAYVELVEGGNVDEAALIEHCKTHVHERAAHPKHIEILSELPKTAVGKVFKPDLRKRAIKRVFNTQLETAGVSAHVADVIDDKKRGLVAQIEKTGEVDEAKMVEVLGQFTRPWDWATP